MKQTTKPPQNCVKCGLCLAACPVYRVLKEEQASPRAKLQLINAFKNQTLGSSPLLKELISRCLMCGSCAVTCPSGINHYEKFMDMRQKMVADLGDTPAIKGLIYLLSREYRIRMGAGMARIGQRLTPDLLARKYRLGNIPVKQFPQLNETPLGRALPETIAPVGEKKGRVVYFTGCATNYMYGDTGRSTVGVLAHLGYEVIIPRDQTCCAIPMMFHGAQDQAFKNIQTNVTALAAQDCDAVIVDCTTCGAALKDEYPRLLNRQLDPADDQALDPHIKGNLHRAAGKKDPAPVSASALKTLAADARKIADKTLDILSFLAGHMDELEFNPLDDPPERAAYHAPCHSRNSFHTHDRVRELLKAVPTIDYVPTPGEADCCGGGGTFFYEHPDIAGVMIHKKVDQVRSARVDLWLTDCPVCRINLAGNLNEKDPIRVLHPVTIIHRALKQP